LRRTCDGFARALACVAVCAVLAWAAAAPECPVPISPAPGEVLDNGRVDRFDDLVWAFRWSACEGAEGYQLVVLAPGTTAPVVDVETAVTEFTGAWVGRRVADGSLDGWSWRVRARFDGDWGPWSDPRAFSVEPADRDPPRPELLTPEPLHPAAGATLPNAGPYPPEEMEWAFRWSRVPTADGYRLAVTAPHLAEPFLEVVLDERQITYLCWASNATCHYFGWPGATPLPTDGGDWSWRVQARLGPAWGPWSEARAFAVAPGPEPGGADLWLRGRLEGWMHGPGRIAAHATGPGAYAGASDWPAVGEGELAADGTFSIRLPPMVLSAGVGEMEMDDGPIGTVVVWGLVVTQEGIAVALAVMATSLEAGDLTWTVPAGAAVGDAVVTWWFAERPATLRSIPLAWRVGQRYSLDLRHGWNLVVTRLAHVAERVGLGTVEIVSADEAPDGVAWHWSWFADARVEGQ